MRRDQLEQLLRDSLHDRAGDVEPTPALWQEVDRRRHTRLRWRTVRLWSAAVASAAAVVAAVVAVPILLDSPEQPDIAVEPPPDPASELVSDSASADQLPSHLVLARGQGLVLLDLRTGAEHDLASPDGRLLDVAVRPGTQPGEDLEVAYTAEHDDGHRVGVIDADGNDQVVDELPVGELVDPAVVWSPDGEWIAFSRGAGESYIGLSRIAGPVGDTPAGAVAHSSVPDHPDDGSLDEGLVLNDWHDVGEGRLAVTGSHADGHSVQVLTDLDGATASLDLTLPDGDRSWTTLARVSASPTRAGPEGSYAMIDDSERRELRWITSPTEDGAELPQPDGLGDGPYVLDALRAAVTVSDREASWLVTHDGQGGDAHIAELEGASAVSIVREVDLDEAATSSDEAAAETPEEGDVLQEVGFEALLPGRALEIAGDELRVRDAAGATTLHSLDAEEGARWLGIGVHPASTSQRLTAVGVAALDPMEAPVLHHIEVVDGELETLEPIEDPDHQPADGWSDVAETRPVFSPDGDAFAWVERQGATLILRVVAWGDDGPGEHTRLETELPEPVEGVLGTQDWVRVGEDDVTRLRLIHATGARPSLELDVRHLDGGVELAGEPRILDDDGDPVRAISVVGSVVERDEGLRWRSAAVDGIEQRLPSAVEPGEFPSMALGPTVDGAAPLHSGGHWWLITPDAVAPWPDEVDGAALIAGS